MMHIFLKGSNSKGSMFGQVVAQRWGAGFDTLNSPVSTRNTVTLNVWPFPFKFCRLSSLLFVPSDVFFVTLPEIYALRRLISA